MRSHDPTSHPPELSGLRFPNLWRIYCTQAEEAAKKGPECALKNRLLFHVSHKLLDENKLMTYHQKLSDTNEDQLSLAAIHYLRSHFQEVGGTTC